MRNYVQSKKCKREIILNYFGFKVPKRNGPLHECCDFHDCIIATFSTIFEESTFQCDLAVTTEDSLNVGPRFKTLDLDTQAKLREELDFFSLIPTWQWKIFSWQHQSKQWRNGRSSRQSCQECAFVNFSNHFPFTAEEMPLQFGRLSGNTFELFSDFMCCSRKYHNHPMEGQSHGKVQTQSFLWKKGC